MKMQLLVIETTLASLKKRHLLVARISRSQGAELECPTVKRNPDRGNFRKKISWFPSPIA